MADIPLRRLSILRRMTIRKRMFLVFVMLSLIPALIISLPIYSLITDRIDKKASNYCIQINEGLRTSYDNVFKEMSEDTINIVYNADIQKKLNDYYAKTDGSMDQYMAISLLREALINQVALLDSVARSNISYNTHNSTIYSRFEMGNYAYLARQESELAEKAKREGGTLSWNSLCSLYNGGNQNILYYDHLSPVIRISRQFSLLKTGEAIGTITLWYSNLDFYNLSRKVNLVGNFYILDDVAMIVFSSDGRHMNEKFEHADILPDVYTQDIFAEKIKNSDSIMTSSFSSEAGYRYVHIQPYSNLIADNKDIALIMFRLLFLSVAIAGVTAFAFSMSILRPLFQVRDELEHIIAKGDFKRRLQVEGNDEISLLSANLNDMVSKLETLIEENYIIRLKESKFKLMALKSQINPHFIFNTLDSIRWIARKNEDFEVSKRLELLSSILRNILLDDRIMATFGQEIKNTKNYLMLQKENIGNMLDIKWDIDRSILKCRTLMLILQPLVENSIFHGMKPRQILKICISIKDLGEQIVIVVKDDGVGISDGVIREVMNADYGGDNIGLYNVRSRIESYFENSHFEITSELNAGTRITITIPKCRDGEGA
jgi:two-component system sensor histidine kinase YesM